jgi:hypothetical protein
MNIAPESPLSGDERQHRLDAHLPARPGAGARATGPGAQPTPLSRASPGPLAVARLGARPSGQQWRSIPRTQVLVP